MPPPSYFTCRTIVSFTAILDCKRENSIVRPKARDHRCGMCVSDIWHLSPPAEALPKIVERFLSQVVAFSNGFPFIGKSIVCFGTLSNHRSFSIPAFREDFLYSNQVKKLFSICVPEKTISVYHRRQLSPDS
ncbi:hypothetical protein TNCV_454581 [Trichonephila clavipes]|nr:hypothetical protein TNCV_454581 [Trichonephila clavipes]